MRIDRRTIACTAVLSALSVAAGVSSAQADSPEPVLSRQHTLLGTWQVTIDPAEPPGAPAGPNFESTLSFGRAGVMTEATSRSTGTSAGVGSWRRTGPTTYSFRFQKYRFNASGQYVGKTVVRESVEIAADGTYRGSATTTVLTVGAAPVSFTSTSTGVRFHV